MPKTASKPKAASRTTAAEDAGAEAGPHDPARPGKSPAKRASKGKKPVSKGMKAADAKVPGKKAAATPRAETPSKPPAKGSAKGSVKGTGKRSASAKKARLPSRKTFLVAATRVADDGTTALQVYAAVTRSPAEALAAARAELGPDVAVELTGKLSNRMAKGLGLKPGALRPI